MRRTSVLSNGCGVQNRELADAVSRGMLVKVERGLYCTPDTWEDKYVVVPSTASCAACSRTTRLSTFLACPTPRRRFSRCRFRGLQSVIREVGEHHDEVIARRSSWLRRDGGRDSLWEHGSCLQCRTYDLRHAQRDRLPGPAGALAGDAGIPLIEREELTETPVLLGEAGVAEKARKYLEVLL